VRGSLSTRTFPTHANIASDPVEIVVSADGKKINIRPLEDDYLEMARHPAYKDSGLVQNSAAASRLIVTGSTYISNMLVQGAENFMNKTKPNDKPMVFQPATHDRVRKINTLTTGVAGVSAKTVGQLTKFAQNAAAGMSGHKKTHAKNMNPDGTPNDKYKPGLLNKSLIAFSTIADGISYSGKNLLTSSGAAASAAVGHKYGAEAGSITSDLAGGVKNVGLVYIDVTGVSRRAIIKSVAKGMVVGKVKDARGNEQTVMVGGGNGGAIDPTDLDPKLGVSNTGGAPAAAGGQVSFGTAAPPSYRTGIGESLEGQPAYYPAEKR
jgi:spartin